MARLLKFRAWDKKTKEMCNVHAIELVDIIEQRPGVSAFTGGSWKKSRWIDKINCELMQFTGLYDKHGNEIYEGDLVEVNNDYQNDVCRVRCEIKWSVGQWIAEDSAGGSWTRQLYHQSDRIELVGNIWEAEKIIEKDLTR